MSQEPRTILMYQDIFLKALHQGAKYNEEKFAMMLGALRNAINVYLKENKRNVSTYTVNRSIDKWAIVPGYDHGERILDYDLVSVEILKNGHFVLSINNGQDGSTAYRDLNSLTCGIQAVLSSTELIYSILNTPEEIR